MRPGVVLVAIKGFLLLLFEAAILIDMVGTFTLIVHCIC
jgi:hypothetical protein